MNTLWRSPWPQWRSHWHVLHAWPASAQALVLIGLTACLTTLMSAVYSGEAWQSWWQAEEEAGVWQTRLEELQTQLQAHQALVAGLQRQTHPSGRPLPAWQLQPPTAEPAAMRGPWLQLAHAHGLQAPPGFSEFGAVWVGPLPNLLAAWQGLANGFPEHAIDAFELTALPETGLLQLSIGWVAWAELSPAQKSPPGLRGLAHPIVPASILKVSLPAVAPPAGGLLHNPFGTAGLRLALPEAAQPDQAGVLRGVPLADLRWMGMWRQSGQTHALLAHAGQVRQVQLGQGMGQDFGEVVQIEPDHLLLREWHANALGQWQVQTTRFPSGGQP